MVRTLHPEKTVAILANKGQTAGEMLSRITLMLENIPFFIQPGSKAVNRSLEFSNNSRIIASATSGNSIRGMSVNLLYLDEFAFVERASEFTHQHILLSLQVKTLKLL